MRLTIKELETFGAIYSKQAVLRRVRGRHSDQRVLAVLDALIRYTADLVSLDTALTSTRRTNNVGCYYNTYC